MKRKVWIEDGSKKFMQTHATTLTKNIIKMIIFLSTNSKRFLYSLFPGLIMETGIDLLFIISLNTILEALVF